MWSRAGAPALRCVPRRGQGLSRAGVPCPSLNAPAAAVELTGSFVTWIGNTWLQPLDAAPLMAVGLAEAGSPHGGEKGLDPAVGCHSHGK